MLPPRSRLDPKGFYTVLGLDPAATPEAIRAAFRRKAREVHPDVSGTGNASAFVVVKQAYDVLSNRSRRASYDQAARRAEEAEVDSQFAAAQAEQADVAASDAADTGWRGVRLWRHRPPERTMRDTPAPFIRKPWLAERPVSLWLGLAAFLCLCIVEAALHLRSSPPVVSAGIKPNAAPVAPLRADARRAVLYGPTPVRLPGTPNAYVLPATGATVLWRRDAARDAYVPVGQLPPFSSVQAVRLYRPSGMVEVLLNEATTAFIASSRLAPGDIDAARRAYCGYNTGRNPYDGELLQRRGQGSGTIELENRSVQPVVVKLRDASNAVVLSVFLAPGSHLDLADIPDGTFHVDFAIGELWSRACNGFAAGMQARRLAANVTTARDARLVVPPDQEAAAIDITDRDFEADGTAEADGGFGQ